MGPVQNRCQLSAAIIVRDEEMSLPRVLTDIDGICDELVVVDTGSSDGTVQLAESLGASVYHFEWVDDFSAARNFAFSKAHGDWIIWLDADDRVPPSAADGFKAIRSDLDNVTGADAIILPYRLGFGPEGDTYTSVNYRERIVRRAASFMWSGAVHETLLLGDAHVVRRSDAWVEHRPTSSIRQHNNQSYYLGLMQELLVRGKRSPKVLLHYGMALLDLSRWQEAIDHLEEYVIVSEHPGSRYRALLDMSVCAGALGNSRAQIFYLHDAIALDSRRPEAFVRLGACYGQLGQPRRAAPFFRAALGCEDVMDGISVPGAGSWRPMLGLALCAIDMGDIEEGRSFFARAGANGAERSQIESIEARLLAESDADNGSRLSRKDWAKTAEPIWRR